MFDVVFVNHNEEEYIVLAKALGYSELVLLTNDINYNYVLTNPSITIKTAYLLKDSSELVRARKKFDFIFADAQRKFFEQKVDYILNSEFSERKDSFHYRNTSLNQVHAKLANENDISIVFNFNTLLRYDNTSRLTYLGRMMQNSTLVRKYELKSATFSLARQPSELRSRAILDGFANVLSINYDNLE